MALQPKTDRLTELAPDRPRLGAFEHPNLVRPGANPHPLVRPGAAARQSPPVRAARERAA